MAASVPVFVTSNTSAGGGSFLTIPTVAGNQIDVGSVLTGAQGIPGSNGTVSQVVGQQGEVQTNNQATAQNAAATTTFLQLCTVSLTPGVWAISGMFQLNCNSSTLTQTANAQGCIGTTTASSTGCTAGVNLLSCTQGGLTGSLNDTWTIPPFQVTITSTTSYYLNVAATFTAGTPQWVGSMYAERVR